MRKSLLMAAMLALVALVATPVLAQSFDFDDDNNNDNNDFDNDDRAFFFDDDDNNDNNDDFFFDDGGGGGVSQEFEQETDETGDVSLDTAVESSGNNSNQCVAPLQFGNTGNLQNAQGFSSFGSSSDNGFNNDFNNDFNQNLDDVEFEGSSFEFNPEQNVQCDQAVQQSAAASG